MAERYQSNSGPPNNKSGQSVHNTGAVRMSVGGAMGNVSNTTGSDQTSRFPNGTRGKRTGGSRGRHPQKFNKGGYGQYGHNMQQQEYFHYGNNYNPHNYQMHPNAFHQTHFHQQHHQQYPTQQMHQMTIRNQSPQQQQQPIPTSQPGQTQPATTQSITPQGLTQQATQLQTQPNTACPSPAVNNGGEESGQNAQTQQQQVQRYPTQEAHFSTNGEQFQSYQSQEFLHNVPQSGFIPHHANVNDGSVHYYPSPQQYYPPNQPFIQYSPSQPFQGQIYQNQNMMMPGSGGYYQNNYYANQGQPYMQQPFVPQQMGVESYSAPIMNTVPVTQTPTVSQAPVTTGAPHQGLATNLPNAPPTSVVPSANIQTSPRPGITHQIGQLSTVTPTPINSSPTAGTSIPPAKPPSQPNTQHQGGFQPKLIEGLPNLNQTNELIVTETNDGESQQQKVETQSVLTGEEKSSIAPVEGLPVVEMPAATTIKFNEQPADTQPPIVLPKPTEPISPLPTQDVDVVSPEAPSPAPKTINGYPEEVDSIKEINNTNCLLDTKSGLSYAKLEEACHLTLTDLEVDTQGNVQRTKATDLSSLNFITDDSDVPKYSSAEAGFVMFPTRILVEYECPDITDAHEADECDTIDTVELNKSLEFVNSELKRDMEDDKVSAVAESFTFGSQTEQQLQEEGPEVATKLEFEPKNKLVEPEIVEAVISNPVAPTEPIPCPAPLEVKITKIEKKKSEESEKLKKTVTGIVTPISPVVARTKPVKKIEKKEKEVIEEEKPTESKPAEPIKVKSNESNGGPVPITPGITKSSTGVFPGDSGPATHSQMPAAAVTRSWAELARPRQQVSKKPTRAIVQEQQKPKEAKENDIKIDPIAKRITDIIYSDDAVKYEELGIPRGLINQANNCWVNSLLQTALVCDPLYKLLKKLLFFTQSTVPGKNDKEIAQIGTEIKRMLPTCAKLAEVFGEILHQKDMQRSPAYEPTGVYAQISKLNPDLTDGQHDAEEALSLLLNAMHDEIVTVRKAAGHTSPGPITTVAPVAVNGLGDGDGEWKTKTKSGRTVKPSVSCTGNSGQSFDTSPISEGFRGLSHSSIKIAGNHPSPPPTEQPFFTLQLDIASPLSKNIDDVIKNIPKEENLEDYKLKDGTVIAANRKMSLAHLPPVLILHMKRFLYNGTTNRVEKLEKNISIKERIELPRESLSPGLRDKVKKNPKYELHGLVLHHGIGAEGGHYTAETKRGSKWFKVDDNKVSEVKINDVINCDSRRTPYLLFYKKVQ